jgi:predicted transcriptional regulator
VRLQELVQPRAFIVPARLELSARLHVLQNKIKQREVCRMTITIAPELEGLVQERAHAAGLSVEAYVESLIREDFDWAECSEPELEETDEEFAEIKAAVEEGLAQAERGETIPAEQVFAELRAKYGLSR